MVALAFNTGYMRRSACAYQVVLCATRLSAAIMAGYLAHVRTDVEAHEMVRNHE